MARYDKVVPKNGVYRATLAADYDPTLVEKIIGVGHDANGRLVKGAGVSGITGVLVLTKAYQAGKRVDPMTHGEIVEFGPTAGIPGVDFGDPGKVYYSDASGNIVGRADEVQTITATSGASPVTLSFDGAGPASVAAAANASTITATQIRTALESLTSLEVGDISVGGPVGGPWPVTFKKTRSGTNVPAISGTNVTVAETTPGGSNSNLVRVGHTVEGQRLVVRVEPS